MNREQAVCETTRSLTRSFTDGTDPWLAKKGQGLRGSESAMRADASERFRRT